MKYSVYRVENPALSGTWFDQLDGHYLLLENNCYVFYKHYPKEPSVVYPVNSFYVVKED